MVLGGIVIPSTNVSEFNNTMQKFRIEQKMFAELKWTKVTNQKLSEYKRFVEYFFALNNTDKLHFHCIIIDNHEVNNKKHTRRDKEIGFYKFYYQLLLHCFGKRYCQDEKEDRFIVYLDYRNTTYSLNTLKIVLNRGMKKKYTVGTSPFVSIEPRDSKKSELVQINDIILGAIGFQKNGYDLLAGTRESKKELSRYIAEQAGLADLKRDSPWGNDRFTIWNFRLQK
jgi:hypothetical protein